MSKNTTLQKQLLIALVSLAIIACIGTLLGLLSAFGILSLSSGIMAIVQGILFLLAVVLPFVYMGIAKKNLFIPLQKCEKRIHQLADGDLRTAVPSYDAQNEIGSLLESTRKITHTLDAIIKDEHQILSAMGNGDFTVVSSDTSLYAKDFAPLLDSLRDIRNHLNSSLYQILESSSQVDAGAEQVSNGAQALSQGATEQASSVEQLAATINDISSQVSESAKSAETASSLATSVGNDMMESNLHMSEMTNAMAEIKESANQIHKIIKTIEDIAFQTNILALNAAVEAARAGSAGKGFAVVAEEVRNLAGKSQDAAKDTTTMIQNAISAVEKGTKIADETAESMNKVVANAQLVVDQISTISETSKTQAEAIAQVTTGIDQISSVVQTNSATAQQSAAASEELSGQAALLKNILSRFHFNREQSRPQARETTVSPKTVIGTDSNPVSYDAQDGPIDTSAYTVPVVNDSSHFVNNYDKY